MTVDLYVCVVVYAYQFLQIEEYQKVFFNYR